MPAHTPIRVLRKMIAESRLQINGNAVAGALKFGWNEEDICKAICKLKASHWHASNPHDRFPECTVDYYKARKLHEGEDVYLHLYVKDNTLIINSFHEL